MTEDKGMSKFFKEPIDFGCFMDGPDRDIVIESDQEITEDKKEPDFVTDREQIWFKDREGKVWYAQKTSFKEMPVQVVRGVEDDRIS